MRYAHSLFLPAVSYITRRYLDVTTITAISALNWQGAGYTLQTQPPAVGSLSPHLQQRCSSIDKETPTNPDGIYNNNKDYKV